jgi:AdoMet-dependent heme synthase
MRTSRRNECTVYRRHTVKECILHRTEVIDLEFLPRLIAWELTGKCNLNCVHCRASAQKERDPQELSTDNIKRVIDDILSFSKPIIILTGGEPLVREDVFEIAKYGTDKGLRVVLGTNGTLITPEIAKRLKSSGIRRVSISLDGASPGAHDAFRKREGAFDGAMSGIKTLKDADIDFQINTTVTKRNIDEIEKLFDLAVGLGAVAHHIFLLVPTGRGKAMEDEEIPPEEYERVLGWMYEKQKEIESDAGKHDNMKEVVAHKQYHGTHPGRTGVGMFMKATCAPHFFRVMDQREKESGGKGLLRRGGPGGRAGLDAMSKGCLAGTGFCFISRKGDVQPCGYLPVTAGNIKDKPFREIWEDSRLFNDLRDPGKLKGKCGLCRYKLMCGGCRARAYAKYNDYLEEEPYCIYTPPGPKRAR